MNPKAFQRRCQRIAEIGCLACRKAGWFSAPDVHHLNLDQHAGQQRLGDEATIGLCVWHHRGQAWDGWTQERMAQFAGPSLKHQPNKFRERFGSDLQLLAWQNELIADCEKQVVGGMPA
jgi:hypothetical protein